VDMTEIERTAGMGQDAITVFPVLLVSQSPSKELSTLHMAVGAAFLLDFVLFQGVCEFL
jgi:hypothetical protein